MIEGNVSLDELMSRLITAQETYQSQLSLEIKEDDERAARDAVKREQDLAFEMSLVVSFPFSETNRLVKRNLNLILPLQRSRQIFLIFIRLTEKKMPLRSEKKKKN